MNIRKKIDYSPMLAGLRTAMESGMTQVELYAEIGRSIALRPEKGAAVAASEYLDRITGQNLSWLQQSRTDSTQPSLSTRPQGSFTMGITRNTTC